MKSSPWRRQRELKKEAIPSQKRLVYYMNLLDTMQEKVFFSMAYLTAGRVSEIVGVKYLRKNHYKLEEESKHGLPSLKVAKNKNGSPVIAKVERIEHNYPGVRAVDIEFGQVEGKNIMYVNLQNRKNKRVKRKILPIPVHLEQDFVKLIRLYIADMPPESPLFDFCIRTGQRMLEKIDMNPHYLRDIRLTHLVQIYDFNTFELIKFAGWKDARPAEHYVRLRVTDLINKY